MQTELRLPETPTGTRTARDQQLMRLNQIARMNPHQVRSLWENIVHLHNTARPQSRGRQRQYRILSEIYTMAQHRNIQLDDLTKPEFEGEGQMRGHPQDREAAGGVRINIPQIQDEHDQQRDENEDPDEEAHDVEDDDDDPDEPTSAIKHIRMGPYSVKMKRLSDDQKAIHNSLLNIQEKASQKAAYDNLVLNSNISKLSGVMGPWSRKLAPAKSFRSENFLYTGKDNKPSLTGDSLSEGKSIRHYKITGWKPVSTDPLNPRDPYYKTFDPKVTRLPGEKFHFFHFSLPLF